MTVQEPFHRRPAAVQREGGFLGEIGGFVAGRPQRLAPAGQPVPRGGLVLRSGDRGYPPPSAAQQVLRGEPGAGGVVEVDDVHAAGEVSGRPTEHHGQPQQA